MQYNKIKKCGLWVALFCTALFLSNTVFGKHSSVNLKAANGNFVVAENGGGGLVNANRPQPREWETFTLLDLDGGELRNGDMVAIKTMNGNFLSANNGGGDKLLADKGKLAEWEAFKIIRVNGGNIISDSDSVAFKTMKGSFISALNGGGREVNAKPTAIGNSETFVLKIIGDPPMSKLSGPFNAPQMIIPFPVGVDDLARDSGDIRYCKNNYLGQNFPNCYRGHNGTDFGLDGHFLTQLVGSIDVYAVASGQVLETGTGNPDYCFFKLPPPPPGSQPEDFIYCLNDPNQAKAANFVKVLQDDGTIAYYYHFKKDSVAVSVGSWIECGQFLGKIGSSGVSSAPHLHLTLRSAKDDIINPYSVGTNSEMLWQSLIGRIPKKTCNVPNSNSNSSPTQNLDPPNSRGLGEATNNPLACKVGLVMKDGVCKRVGVPPGGRCNDNELCGPGLGCNNDGKCVLRRP